MNDYVRIFDTTLRDGEQSPGATLDSHDKLEIAGQLARLGVDVIEAGFPAASPGDLESVRRISEVVGTPDGPIIAGLARAVTKDIDACREAVRAAAKPRIHTFIATSDIHLKHKLRMNRDQVLARAAEMVAYARQYCDDVEFSAEDASRSDPAFLHEVLAAVIEAGASTVNIPDTVGYAEPGEFAELIRGVMANVPGVDRCIVSTHCHDDLGLAVSNTLAGIQAGARQVEVTMNGLGERAGNAALEEVVMALHTRRGRFAMRTGIDTAQLMRTSHLVSVRTGITVPPNKAVVGANAFAHESGIHQDGMLKHQTTYEIMKPETVGLTQSKLVLGKHSGRHAFRSRLAELGYEHLDKGQVNRAFERFKNLADKKKVVTEADLEALLADEFYQPPQVFVLESVHVSCGLPALPTASVSITTPDGSYQTQASTGTGPVHAIFTAIDHIVPIAVKLEEYIVHAVTGGMNALGEVTVRVQTCDEAPRTFSGHGADTDILVASAKAYVAALNKIAMAAGFKPPGAGDESQAASDSQSEQVVSEP
ncbi:MAG: 2-isopropylmalate synthase [Phycisphaerales bacterium]|nr:MAG: 2-isopropylmalate synthase [Phycisphaerales bacterium]